MHFETIAELAKVCPNLTAQQVIDGRAYLNGWQNFTVGDESLRSFCNLVAELYGGRAITKARISHKLYYCGGQHWGLERTMVECGIDAKGNDCYSVSYTAGQSYTEEGAVIRRALK